MVTNGNKIKPRDIVLNRREMVAIQHWIYRKPIRTIAKEQKWGVQTIWRDLQYLKKQFKNQPLIIDRSDLLKKLLYQRNYNLQKLAELREKLQDEENPSEERRVIQLIEDINSQNIKDMQELEFIDKPKERQEVEVKDYKFIVEDQYKNAKRNILKNRKTQEKPK